MKTTTTRKKTAVAVFFAALGLFFAACGNATSPTPAITGGTVAAPTATPPEGTYTSAQSVTLDSTTEGANFYYTLDGSAPTASSTPYSSPIAISSTTTLKAIAVKEGMVNSSVLTAVYTINIPPVSTITVTSDADSGAGSLRQAITDAPANGTTTITIDDSVKTISLASQLSIGKNITIEGNGAVITRSSSWTTESTVSQLLYVNSSAAVVQINRVHFKDGRATDYGAAIRNAGTLTLESCIFSGNRTSSSFAFGGAVYNSGTMTVTGCTFYGNSATNFGGAINHTSGTLTLTGNLFYGNTAHYGPVVYGSSGTTISSNGYNVVDVALGTGNTQSGWTAATGDKTISGLPVSSKTFKLFQNSDATNVITTLPEGYPATDFYGNPISAGAAAGAVQASVSENGYFIELSVNNTGAGTVNVSPEPDEDGLYSGSTTLTPTANTGYTFMYWLVDDSKQTGNPLTVTSRAKVVAVFTRTVIITSSADTNTSGTLRYALNNAQNEDIISISGITAIQLTSALPQITKSITIEGNGAVITRSSSWTTESTSSQLLYVDSSTAVVQINRVHFKDGRATDNGAAIRNAGTLTLESCIFSGNRTSNRLAYGGAVYNSGTMMIKGCTFYGNTTYRGGAIYNISGSLTLTGNLFYGNTASYGPVVYCISGTISSNGYNVVDVALGTGNTQSGWTAVTGDKTISIWPTISGKSFKLFPDGDAVNVITTLPEGYPATDFYGNPINNGAAAGAVQANVSGSGSYIELSVNNPNVGRVEITPPLDPDGFLSSPVFQLDVYGVTGYSIAYWLANGIKQNDIIIISGHTKIMAILSRTVTSSADTNTSGTLRYALNNAQDGDIINISGITTIQLTSALPIITKNITIEGNGAVITRSSSWTIETTSSQLLNINSGTTVQINRVHFKDGKATDYGAAIDNSGTLTLESCIFSGNRTSDSLAYGGAVYNSGTMTVKGCTFYGNSTYRGGAIYNNSGTLTLIGNLFYGNTASYGPVVYRNLGTVSSGGYNVVDAAYGTGTSQCGWTAVTGDTTFSARGISGVPFNTTTFEPVSDLRNVIPSAIAGFPATDFNGAARTWPGAPGAVK